MDLVTRCSLNLKLLSYIDANGSIEQLFVVVAVIAVSIKTI
jgi:hypothetical protein